MNPEEEEEKKKSGLVECSGLRMEAWVRIPLLTKYFCPPYNLQVRNFHVAS